MTAIITISFMMRATSIIGWIPLCIVKIIVDNSFKPLLIAIVLVSLPIIALNVALDTYYYLGIVDFENWVFTNYNFFKVNVLDG